MKGSTRISAAPAETTRSAVLRVARLQFAMRPYADVTIRGIAAEAGISPALVMKFFGSKQALLEETSDFGALFDALVDAPRDDLGRHLVRCLLEHHGTPDATDPFLLLMFLTGRETRPDAIREQIRTQFLDRLAARLDSPDAGLRAELICGQLLGLAAMRRVFVSPALAGRSTKEVAERVGPLVQALIDGDVNPVRASRRAASRR